MQRPVRVVFSFIPVLLTLFAEELVGWGGAVGESEARVKTCQDDRKRERKKRGAF